MNITGDFKNVSDELPEIPKRKLVVAVYFICKGVLHKGEYHTNGVFYSYQNQGIDCLATPSGRYKSINGKGKADVCNSWCYLHELKIA